MEEVIMMMMIMKEFPPPILIWTYNTAYSMYIHVNPIGQRFEPHGNVVIKPKLCDLV